ncbi:PREDICTED: protein LOW PSII ACCUMULATION 3, chloroplastic [Camelina sativa]|uniref:Protein LOW PSII ACCUMULATION 3, chloroplastic n=1 Tax=Camelina sativa TaxID=90675 RepID=A0ABM0UDQ4_CAMSA|nr:PREDICTED: protein LOW PSII ACCUMULATION 3, chloroplastic [Camelina sativa]
MVLMSPSFSIATTVSLSPASLTGTLVSNSKNVLCGLYWKNNDVTKMNRNLKFSVCSVSGGYNTSVENVPFPRDYVELINQAKEAVELAMKDEKQLMEIEFPTSGLASVPGDGEGATEMTESINMIREFCDRLLPPEKARTTRIFFPEANEVKFAQKTVFGGTYFKLDYLTKPSLFEDFGFFERVKMVDRVKSEDQLFLVGYPYFNVNEMLVVEELYKEAVVNTDRKLIIFNGELDRIRSGYYPKFFYPKLAALTQTLLPKMETVYYIHNFKGQKGGVLFRCYPGPWQVLRRTRNKYICVHQQESMPSLKEVALDILASA